MVKPVSPPGPSDANVATPGGQVAALQLPAGVLGSSERLMAEYAAVVERTCEFSKDVGDVVRGDPNAMAGILQALSHMTSQVFRRWNVEILYLLSVENRLRFSQLRAYVPGISGRSLSLKLDEMEQLGLVHREVGDGKPPQVVYSLTEQGRMLTRLSFPMALSLLMPEIGKQLQKP